MTDGSTATNPKVEYVWVLLTFSVIWNVISTLWFTRRVNCDCAQLGRR